MSHHHHHDVSSSLSFEEKLIKLLSHWIKHNDDHAATYDQWAEKAKENELDDVSALLSEATETVRVVSEKFEAALNLLDGGKP